MKKLQILFLLLFAAMSVNAQSYYRSTGSNVNVRKGPGKNFAVHRGDPESGLLMSRGTYLQLAKGEIVKYAGAKKNGFIKIYVANVAADGCGQWGIDQPCWVSSQFLTPATRCSLCRGTGRARGRCRSEMHGYLNDMLFWGCPDCRCSKCDGLGWL